MINYMIMTMVNYMIMIICCLNNTANIRRNLTRIMYIDLINNFEFQESEFQVPYMMISGAMTVSGGIHDALRCHDSLR